MSSTLHRIWSLTRKDLKLFAQQPGEWLLVFLTPFLFIAIMGAAFGGGGSPTVALYAVDEDNSVSSREVLHTLVNAPGLEVSVVEHRADADRLVGRGERMAALVIPLGFEQALHTPAGAGLTVIVDPAQSERAAIVSGLAGSALAPFRLAAELNRAAEGNVEVSVGGPAERETDYQDALSGFMAAAIKSQVAAEIQETLEDPLIRVALQDTAGLETGATAARTPTLMEYLVPGYSLTFAFFLLNTLALSISKERSQGTFRRLLSMPANRAVLLVGKGLPFFVVALAQMVLVALVSHYVFRMDLGDAPGALILLAAATSAALVGLGLFLASLARTAGAGGGLASLLTIIMAAVSGSLFPGIRVPLLEYATPHYWALNGFQDVVTRGMGLQGALLPIAVLCVMATAFAALGVRRLRIA
ncbi:MAG: ABC transporter permease [Anaerolineae bacterium]